jgi:hypothetical protein
MNWGGAQAAMTVEAVYRIGRDSRSQIVIDDTSVSREHAELHVLADGRVRLVDLGSMNGVRLRDGEQWRRIDGSAVVGPDDPVRFGDHATTSRSLLNKMSLGAGAGPVRAGGSMPAPATPPLAAPGAGGEFARLIRRTTVPAPKEPFGLGRQEPSLHLPPMRRASPAAPPSREPAPAATAALPQFPKAPPAPPSLPPLPAAADREAGMALAAAAGYRAEPSGPRRPLREPPPSAPASDEADLPDTPPPLSSANRPSMPSTSALRRRQRARTWAIAASALLVGCGLAYGALIQFGLAPFGAAGNRAAPPSSAAGPGVPGVEAERADVAPPKDAPPAAAPPATEERTLPPPPPRAWTAQIPGLGASAILAAAPHPLGGACLAGETALPGGGMEAWILRLDEQGRTLWQRRPGGPRRDAATAVAASPDGGCVAAGYADDETKIWISRLGPSGQQVWEKTLTAGARARAGAIVRLREGGYVIAATAHQSAAGPSHAVLIRISADGVLRWNKVLAAPESALGDVREAPGGGLYTAGWGRAKSGDPHGLWVTRLDKNGKILWQRLLALDGAPLSAFVRPAADGTAFVAASSDTGASQSGAALRIVRLGPRGETLWDRAEAVAGSRRAAGAVLLKGGFAVAGDGGPGGKPEIWLARFDAAGTLQQHERFAANGQDRAGGLAALRDGRLLLAGTAEIGQGGLRGAGLRFLDKQETAER